MFTYQYENGKYQIFHHGILVRTLVLLLVLCAWYASMSFLFGFLAFWNCQCVCAMYIMNVVFVFLLLVVVVAVFISVIHSFYPSQWLTLSFWIRLKRVHYILCLCCIYDSFFCCCCCCLVLVVYVLQLLLLLLFKPTVAQADHHLTYHCCKWPNRKFGEFRVDVKKKKTIFVIEVSFASVLFECPLYTLFKMQATNSKQLPNSVSASFFHRLVWIFVVGTVNT